MKFLNLDRPFKSELKKEIRLLIVLTISFSIAFSWRQTMFDYAMSFVEWLFSIEAGLTANIMASILITIIGLILIFITSQVLKKMEPYES